MNSTGLARFERICEAYIHGGEESRKVILSCLPEKERQTFLKGCGLFHLLTDETFYRHVQKAIAEQMLKEERK